MSDTRQEQGGDSRGEAIGGGAIEELVRETATRDLTRIPMAAAGDATSFVGEVVMYARERSKRPRAALTAPAAFVFSDYPARTAEEQGLTRVRGFKCAFDNDISGGIYVVGSLVGEAYGTLSNIDDVTSMFDELARRGLQSFPTVLLLPEYELVDCRHGSVAEEQCVLFQLRSEAVSIETVDRLLSGFHRSFIERPRDGSPIWHDKDRRVPCYRTEQVIQRLLLPVARAFFDTTHLVSDETDLRSGRADISLLPLEPEVAGGSCVLELKVLRAKSFHRDASQARACRDGVNAAALAKGITQAQSYRRDFRCDHAFLCAYDMREDYADRELIDRYAGDAQANNVQLRRYFVFNSAEAYRQAQPGAVPVRRRPRAKRGRPAGKVAPTRDADTEATTAASGKRISESSAKKGKSSRRRENK